MLCQRRPDLLQSVQCAYRQAYAAVWGFRLPEVDSNELCVLLFGDAFRKRPYGRHRGPGSQFDHHELLTDRTQPGVQPMLLLSISPRVPPIISEHQDIRSGKSPAHRALRQLAFAPQRGLIDFRHERISRENAHPAPLHALRVMNAPMDFRDLILGKPGALKMPVHVRGEDEGAAFHSGAPLAKNLKAGVRGCGAVKIEPVPIKSPGQSRVLDEPPRSRQFRKLQAEAPIGRVSPPEAFRSAEIRQSRIRHRRQSAGLAHSQLPPPQA